MNIFEWTNEQIYILVFVETPEVGIIGIFVELQMEIYWK